MPSDTRKRLSLQVTDDEFAQITLAALAQDRSISAVVREALRTTGVTTVRPPDAPVSAAVREFLASGRFEK